MDSAAADERKYVDRISILKLCFQTAFCMNRCPIFEYNEVRFKLTTFKELFAAFRKIRDEIQEFTNSCPGFKLKSLFFSLEHISQVSEKFYFYPQ